MKTKLKKPLLIIVAIMFFSGCAMLQGKREVLPDNTFSCTNPSLTLKLDKEFEYKGMLKKNDNTSDMNNFLNYTHTTNEFFLWSNKDNDEFIIVCFSKLLDSRWEWSSKYYFPEKYRNQVMIENFGGKKWRTLYREIKIDAQTNLDKNNVHICGNYYGTAFAAGGGSQIAINIYYLTKEPHLGRAVDKIICIKK